MEDASQFDDQQALAAYLLPSERILWSGKPPRGFLFRKSDLFLIPFSLLWAGFAVFWEYTAFTQGAPPFFLLFGGVFVLIGLLVTAGRFLFDKWIREKTVYAVTEGRALILAGLFRRTLTALNIRSLQGVGLEMYDAGRGTITFGPVSATSAIVRNPSWPGTGRYAPPMFERVENAAEVYRLLQPSANNERRESVSPF